MKKIYESASLHYKDKDWEKASKDYTKILNSSSEEATEQIYVKLAICQRFIKNYADSEYYLKRGLEKFPKSTNLWIEYAALENIREQWQQAIVLWEKAKNKTKKFSVLDYRRYAKAYEALNDTKNLTTLVNEGLRLYPEDEHLNSLNNKVSVFKIAIQFYGHSRSFQETFASFKKYVLDVNKNIKIDIYIHTWDEKEHSTIKAHYKKDQKFAGIPLTDFDKDFIEKHYRPKGFKVDSQLSLSKEETQKIHANGFNPDNYKIINNISYSMFEANRLRQESTFDYDFVLMTRLDILFKKPLLFEKLSSNKIKSFMNFTDKELEESVFYSYMETADFYRNQKKYITGIDLFMFAKPSVMTKITNWHTGLLDHRPQGTENALTQQIQTLGIEQHLLYYSKPESWTILRTNDASIAEESTEDIIYTQRNLWNYTASKKYYLLALKSDNSLLFEYIIFLADTGQLEVLYAVIESYTFAYIEALILDAKYMSIYKKQVHYMLKFYKYEYIPAHSLAIETRNIEKNLLALTQQSDASVLYSYLAKNEKVFGKDNGKTQMILNFSLNRLMDANLLSLAIALQVIDLYKEDCTVNRERKKYVLSRFIDYFHAQGERDFFTYLSIKGGYIQKISSILHRYGKHESGAKLYLKKFQSLVKLHSLTPNKITNTPRVAVCISGMLRGDAKSVLDLLSKNIIEPLQADVFIHTWDEQQSWLGLAGDVNWVYRQFGEEILRQCPKELRMKPFMQKNFPKVFESLSQIVSNPIDSAYVDTLIHSKALCLENQEDFLEDITFSVENLKTRGHLNQAKMLYGIHKSMYLMTEYEEKHHIHYDYVVRCRPDIGLQGSLTHAQLQVLDTNEIIVDFYPYGPQDQFSAGTRNAMLCLSNLWKEIINKEALSPFEDYPGLDSHNLLYLWMLKNDLITHPSKIKRDVSMALQNTKIPSISQALALDMATLDDNYKNRDDFKDFFQQLMDLS